MGKPFHRSGANNRAVYAAVADAAENERSTDDLSDIEVIVKYSGDINRPANELDAQAEILLQNYAIITIDRRKLNQLASYTEVESIELPRQLFIESSFNLTSSCISTANESSGGLTGKGVIVAVIDYGIDYTHMDFRNEDGTSRILYLWDQTQTGIPPEGFSAGAEYSQSLINEALNSEMPLSIVPSRDTSGHGTAVAGIAAGNGRQSKGVNKGVAPQADIIVVKLGSRGFKSFARTTELMRALKYVIQKAKDLNKPVAVNISFGMNNGSHKGDSLFETYISDVSTVWKNAIVIPTGNEGAAGHHYSYKLTSNNVHEAEFFTAKGISNFYLSLWKNFSDVFSVELIFPDGSSSGVINIENQIINIKKENINLLVVYGQPSHYSVRQEIFFELQATNDPVPAGIWKLRMITSAIVDGQIDIWLPTTEEVTEQTLFANPDRYLTMTIPSTSQKVIKVAGYNDRVGNIAEFSGAGSNNSDVILPDIAAPAVGILTVKNGGGYDSYTGTSMAAPFVTGAAALMMQWGIVSKNDQFLYGERIKAFLRLGANRKATLKYPNPDFGYGTLCFDKTLQNLKKYKWGGGYRWLQI